MILSLSRSLTKTNLSHGQRISTIIGAKRVVLLPEPAAVVVIEAVSIELVVFDHSSDVSNGFRPSNSQIQATKQSMARLVAPIGNFEVPIHISPSVGHVDLR